MRCGRWQVGRTRDAHRSGCVAAAALLALASASATLPACSTIVDERLDDRSRGQRDAGGAGETASGGMAGRPPGGLAGVDDPRFDGGGAQGAGDAGPDAPFDRDAASGATRDGGGSDATLPADAGGAAPASTLAALSTGVDHSCVIVDGTLVCWGSMTKSRLDAPPGRFKAVSAGAEHTCAIDESDALHCWGDNLSGQALAPAGRYKAVAAGHAHTCAIDLDDELACFGDDGAGQASPPPGRFSAVAAGQAHSCGIELGSGGIVCWGSTSGFRTAAPSGVFLALDLGATHACALRDDREIVCWGQTNQGLTRALSGPFEQVHVSDGVSCGLRADGRAACWGTESILSLPSDSRFRVFSWSFFRGCGIEHDDALHCWDRRGGIGAIPSLGAR